MLPRFQGAGGCLFVASLLGFYLLIVQLFESTGFPCFLPVGDLATLWERNQKRSVSTKIQAQMMLTKAKGASDTMPRRHWPPVGTELPNDYLHCIIQSWVKNESHEWWCFKNASVPRCRYPSQRRLVKRYIFLVGVVVAEAQFCWTSVELVFQIWFTIETQPWNSTV